MEFRHLGTTSLETYGMLQVGGQQVQQRHDELLRLVARVGLRDRLLFAEPIVTWPSSGVAGHVAWYGDARHGDPALPSLTGQAYDRAANLLRETLSTLLTANLGPDEAALVRAACVLSTLEGVLIDGERVVLLGWGLVPGRSGKSPPGVPALAATPLAPFLPASQEAPTISLPGSKDAPSESPSFVRSDPILPSPVSHAALGDLPQNRDTETGMLAWHAATAAVFVLLGFLAGMRMVAPGRLADWLDLSGL